jgi:hypothetical protein
LRLTKNWQIYILKESNNKRKIKWSNDSMTGKIHCWGSIWQAFVETWDLVLGFEVLTAGFMKNSVSWDIAPCNQLKVNRRLGDICRFHHQGRRISQTRNQRERSSAFPLVFVGLVYLKNWADMFLRNVGWLSTDYTALYPRRQTSLWDLSHYS